MSQETKSDRLKARASMLRKSRAFFAKRNVLEVDCPILSPYASIDAHIDLITAKAFGHQTLYLHSSPEYGMKRLLADGIGDIFQLSHVFRDGEYGNKHNPEFTLTEWYRVGFSFEEMIQETIDYISLFIPCNTKHTYSYKELFLKYVELDPFTCPVEDLKGLLDAIHNPPALSDRDAWLNLVLGLLIEPNLQDLTILYDYPATQAALAQTHLVDGHKVAKRFEIYYHDVELANGYAELTDAKEQKRRFKESNAQRKTLGKKELPEDPHFLQALEKGLPPCCGVAVGFDRLMMLMLKETDLSSVLPVPWETPS